MWCVRCEGWWSKLSLSGCGGQPPDAGNRGRGREGEGKAERRPMRMFKNARGHFGGFEPRGEVTSTEHASKVTDKSSMRADEM